MALPGREFRLSRERQYALYEQIGDLSRPTWAFYLMVALSSIIASYGLLANSTAVVVGAMLVAPLMGPIFGIALGLLGGSRRILTRATFAELIGVLVAIGTGLLIGLMPWRVEFGSEIIARTQPTLYDMVIALVSGLAGAYALVNERISPALPGVAIAVAIVPPLATCGLCLSAAQWEWALGAFLLFVANFLAIEIAAAFVFTLSGMIEIATREVVTFADFAKHFAFSLVALVLIGAFMTRALTGVIADSRLHREVADCLEEYVGSTSGARVSDFSVQDLDGTVEVTAAVLTPAEFAPSQVAWIEERLKGGLDREVHLVVRSLLSRDADRHGPVFVERAELKRRTKAESDRAFLGRMSGELSEELKSVPGARLVEIWQEPEEQEVLLIARVETPEPIVPEQVAEMQAELQKGTGAQIRLLVRSVLTRDADGDRYLFAAEQQAEQLAGEELARYNRLKATLEEQLMQMLPGACLDEVRWAEHEGRARVLMVIRGPRVLAPEEIARLQTSIRASVKPGIELIARCQVGADVGALGTVDTLDETTLAPGYVKAEPAVTEKAPATE